MTSRQKRASAWSSSAGGSGRPLPGTIGTSEMSAADRRGIGGKLPSNTQLIHEPVGDPERSVRTLAKTHVSKTKVTPRRHLLRLHFLLTAPHPALPYRWGMGARRVGPVRWAPRSCHVAARPMKE